MSPRTHTRISTRALTGAGTLALSALLLAGCNVLNETSDRQSSNPEQTQEEKSDAELDEVQINLKDGRTITCVKYDGYNGRGGLSCDWDNAKEPVE